MPFIPHIRSLYIPFIADHAHGNNIDPRELAYQILDIVHLRPEIELCYMGLTHKCFEILENRPTNYDLRNDSINGEGGAAAHGYASHDPVIISDDIELPFEDVLDYSEFCVFVRSADAAKRGFLLRLLRGISRDEWTKMWMRLKKVTRHFEYQYPSRSGDAVQMIWSAVARKMHSVQLQLHKRGRFQRTGSES